MTPLSRPLPVHKDVVNAQVRLRDAIATTPVLRNERLDSMAGASLWIKAENLQHNGAFKARGAYNTVAQLRPEELAKGLVTYSSGNHGLAVAWCASLFDLRAKIFMPTNAPAVKIEAVKRFGAEVILVGTTSLERQAAAHEDVATSGAVIIEPFDHPHTIAGQGTASLELRQEVFEQTRGKGLDQLFVPVGGGGLIAGACLAFEGTDTQIIGVEAKGCDSLNQSLASGSIVSVTPGPSIADGLKPTRVGEMNFAICRERVAASAIVTDEDLGNAVVRLLLWGKTLVEPSGAAALAAALKSARPGANVGVILSGGNIAPESLRSLIGQYGSKL
jgi:threonine dehydratase